MYIYIYIYIADLSLSLSRRNASRRRWEPPGENWTIVGAYIRILNAYNNHIYIYIYVCLCISVYIK